MWLLPNPLDLLVCHTGRVGRPKPPGLCPRIKTRPKPGLGRVALTGLGRPKLPKLA